MLKYETVIHIINEGDDRFDAGERAGNIIGNLNITDDMVIYCEPTHLHRCHAKPVIDSFAEQYLV